MGNEKHCLEFMWTGIGQQYIAWSQRIFEVTIHDKEKIEQSKFTSLVEIELR